MPNETDNLRHGVTAKARARAMASYMISHNDKHIDELAALVEEMDKDAARMLLEAIGSYEVGNTLLEQFIEYLEQH